MIQAGMTVKANLPRSIAAMNKVIRLAEGDLWQNNKVLDIARNGTIVCYGPDVEPMYEAGRRMYESGHRPHIHLPFDKTIAVVKLDGSPILCFFLCEHEEEIMIFHARFGVKSDPGGILAVPECYFYQMSGGLIHARNSDFDAYLRRDAEHDRLTRENDKRNGGIMRALMAMLMGVQETRAGLMTRPALDHRLDRDRQAARKAGSACLNYRVLEMDPGQAPRFRSEPLGGTHASPRWHERIGHVRHLPDGKTTWVRACEVGDKARGMVLKDYAIAKETPDDGPRSAE